MRELTKALNSFSWSMSLFAAQQAVELLRNPIPGGVHPSESGLSAVTEAGERQLGPTLGRAFRAGDRLQRSAVDLAFAFATLQVLDPNRAVALSARLLRDSTAALRSLLPGGGEERCTCDDRSAGWWGRSERSGTIEAGR